MNDSALRSRDEVVTKLNSLIESRLTPDFLREVSKPGNLDWLEAMVKTAFDRIERKPSMARSRSIG